MKKQKQNKKVAEYLNGCCLNNIPRNVHDVQILIPRHEVNIDGCAGVTGCLNSTVCHIGKLIIDGRVAPDSLVIHVTVEVQVNRCHKVVIAIAWGCDRYFGAVHIAKELLYLIVGAQIARHFVVDILTAFPGKL